MSTQNLHFKVHSVRTLTSPYSKDDKDESTLETIYYVLVNMKDLPAGISLKVNPREPNMNTAIGKELRAAVKEPETDFYLNNRGIIIAARTFSFNPSSSEVSIDLGDPDNADDMDRYGILDGGHTYTAIIDERDNIPEDLEKYVRLEVITNIQNIARLSDARNTSRQVSDIALFNLDEHFEDIRAAVQATSFVNRIAYKDNEAKDIPILNLLRLLFAFDIDRYPDASAAPIQSFSGKAQVFKRYSDAYQSPFYKSLTKELPVLSSLYDRIEVDLPQKYRAYKESQGMTSHFGSRRGVEKVTEKNGQPTGKTLLSTYSETPMKYQIASGYIYPIFGAFRALLRRNKDSDEVSWLFDPLSIWDEIGVQLVQNTFETESNPQMAGKNKRLWIGNYNIVENQCFRKLLENSNQNK